MNPVVQRCEVTKANFRVIRGDGACLFRAVSFLVTGAEEQHQFFRELVVDYVCDRWVSRGDRGHHGEDLHDGFKDLLSREVRNAQGVMVDQAFEKKEDYREHMLNQGTYGGFPELNVLALALKKQFNVICILADAEGNPFVEVMDLHPEHENEQQSVYYLRLTGRDTPAAHYNAFIEVPQIPERSKNTVDDTGSAPGPSGAPAGPSGSGDLQRALCEATGAFYVAIPRNNNALFASLSFARYAADRVVALRYVLSKAVNSLTLDEFKKNVLCAAANKVYGSVAEYVSATKAGSSIGTYAEASLLTQHLGRSIAIVSVRGNGGPPVAELTHVFPFEGAEVIVLRETEGPHFDVYEDTPPLFVEAIQQLVSDENSPPSSPLSKPPRKPRRKRNNRSPPISPVKRPRRNPKNNEISQPGGDSGPHSSPDQSADKDSKAFPVPDRPMSFADICGSAVPSDMVCPVTKSKFVSQDADGSSLFRAFALALNSDQRISSNLRNHVVNHVINNWSDFRKDTKRIQVKVSNFRTPVTYKTWMSNLFAPTYIAELRALSVLYDARIIVVSVRECDKFVGLQGVFGTSSSKVVVLRVSDWGNRHQVFGLFVTFSERLRQIISSALPKMHPGEQQSQSGETTPKKDKERDGRGSVTPRTTPASGKGGKGRGSSVTPNKTPNKRNRNDSSVTETPKRRHVDDEIEQVDDVPPDAFIIPQDPVDFVEYDASGSSAESNADSDEEAGGSDLSSEESAADSDVDRVERPNEWIPLESIRVAQNRLRLSYNSIRRTYMAAAVYGDERWGDLPALQLPALTYTCPYCGARFRRTELTQQNKTELCCRMGRVEFPAESRFREPTDERIKRLYLNDDVLADDFKKNILAYNRMFSTVQVIARGLNSQRGHLSVLTVNGKVTYQPNSFQVADAVLPGQLYFVEQDANTVAHRMATSSEMVELQEELVVLFQNYLEQNNDFIKCFKTTREILAEERAAAEREGREVRDIVLAINPRPKTRQGYRVTMEDLYNYMLDNEYARPCRDFVAAVFTGTPADFSYDTLYAARRQHENEPFAPLREQNVTVDVQSYPLIHLHGERSWTDCERDGKTCSLLEYYRLRLQKRDSDDEFSPLLMSGKLLSQYILDAAIKIQYNKLQYFADNQVRLMAAEYRTLRAYVEEQAARLGRRVRDDGFGVGRFKILPSAMDSSNRYRQQRFMNGMALASNVGTPSWFITMTCNPNWPEIQAELNGRHWMERPDVVARVFDNRKRELMVDLVQDQVFGRVAGYFTTVEFQKSSLPHIHILLIMHEDDRPKTEEDVDRLVCAEIPRRSRDKANKEYRDLVLRHMMHHACHAAPRVSVAKKPGCFADGRKCRFRFPQNFSERTNIEARYVQYKRRANGRTVNCKQYRVPLDNRNVVPHNRYLLMRHQCHINVEYKMSTLQSFKYLCIYVNKNPDKTYVSLTSMNRNNEQETEWYEWDEVEHFKEMLYLSPTEGVYIIMGYGLGDISHTVRVLPVHLEHRNVTMFVEGQAQGMSVEEAENRAATKLTEWFRLNEQYFDEHGVRGDNLYADVVKTHVWKNRAWHERLRGDTKVIGRLMLVTPSGRSMELFYLRTLLLNVPGPLSHDDLLKVPGKEEPCGSYKEACAELGLVHRENEGYEIMLELSHLMRASNLRYFFCLIIKHCDITDASDLWLEFRVHMSDDFSHRLGAAEPGPIHFNMALKRIYELLTELDVDVTTLNLPEVDETLLPNLQDEGEPQVGLQRDIHFSTEEAAEAVRSLNVGQRSVFDSVLLAIQSGSGASERLFLVHGAGGVGKTYLYNTIVKHCIANAVNVACCAATGIAAILLLKGMTAHRLFGIPVNPDRDQLVADTVTSSISVESKAAQYLRDTKVFIWDEVSMVNCWQMNLVDRFLRRLMNTNEPMGGKVFILGGDFKQTLPVVKGGSRHEIIRSTIMFSDVWPHLVVYQLTQNVRAAEDPAFAEWLLTVGDGTGNIRGSVRVELPMKFYCDSLDNLIDEVFGVGAAPEATDAIILTPLNRDMRKVNEVVFDRQPGDTVTFLAANSFIPDAKVDAAMSYTVTPEILQEYESANLPPHKLQVKVGCIVMLLSNLNVGGGLCNGTRLKVLAIHSRTIRCEILNGPHAGMDTYLFRVKLFRDEDLPGTILREQFPIRLAYSATITKGQGSTYNKVGIFLPQPCFSHGQIYVALSRAKRSDCVKIHLRPGTEQGVARARRAKKDYRIFTRNEVYAEILEAIRTHPNLR